MSDLDLTKYANSVGLVYDLSLPVRYPLAAVWQVDAETVVSCAHSVILYSKILKALRVRFPTSGREYSVKSVVYHPKVDKAILKTMAKQGLTDPVNGLPLQKHNVALLKLSPNVEELRPEEIEEINDSFERFLPEHEPGLGGSLAEIELPLVVQTITNARKTGTVSILDERNRVVGKLFCRNGRATHAYYFNLINENAIYQIIMHRLTGSFYFTSEEAPDWTTVAEISRPIDMLLIESLRRSDELEKMSSIVGGPSSLFVRVTPQPNYDILPPDAREATKLLWPLLDGGTPLGLMWQIAGVDDYAIYSAMQELVKTRQVSYFEAPFVKGGGEMVPLMLGVQTPLSPNDLVTALWVEDSSLAPLIRPGTLLGSVKDLDPSHVLHNIGLPFEAAGCPIFKDGAVIGIHCGTVPPDPAVVTPDGGFHQMIWVQQVVECLQDAGNGELVKKLTLSGEEDTPEAAARAGCRQVARIQCPKCGRSSMDEPNFCKGCGQRLIQDSDYKGPIGKRLTSLTKAKTKMIGKTKVNSGPRIIKTEASGQRVNPVLLAMLLTLIFVGGGAACMAMIPRPNFISATPVKCADAGKAWLATALIEFQGPKDFRRDDNYVLNGPAQFSIGILPKRPCYLYAFTLQNSGRVNLHSPTTPAQDVILDQGVTYLLKSDGLERTPLSQQHITFFGCENTDGVEKFILVASGMKSAILGMKDPAAQDKAIKQFVTQADQLASCNSHEGGVIVHARGLGEQFFEQAPAGSHLGVNGLMGKDVYICVVEVRHKKDASLDNQEPSEQSSKQSLPKPETLKPAATVEPPQEPETPKTDAAAPGPAPSSSPDTAPNEEPTTDSTKAGPTAET